MGYNEFSNIGKQIQDAVEDAIDSMDFKQLNQMISNTANDVVDEVRRQFIGSNLTGYKRRYEYHQDSNISHKQSRPEPLHETNYSASSSATYQHRKAPTQKAEKSGSFSSNLRIHPPSRVKGILLTMFGSIGLGPTTIGLLAALFLSLLSNTVRGATWGLIIFLLILEGIFGPMIGIGNSIRGRLAQLKLYLRKVDNKTYCPIRELVDCAGRPEKFATRDLKKMIKDGILPHAHLDEQNTHLMLDDKTYQQYLQSTGSLELHTQEAQSIQDSPKAAPPKFDNRMSRVTVEGQAYLKTLRDANEAIPGEVISFKLDCLENIIEKIFDVIDRHPEQLNDIERFMGYYLPITVKFINAYRDFDSVGIGGENISMAKAEAEVILDTINQAFEQLLDGLYQDEAFDISTDATVLQTMLKKDGLVNSDFDGRRESWTRIITAQLHRY